MYKRVKIFNIVVIVIVKGENKVKSYFVGFLQNPTLYASHKTNSNVGAKGK